MIKQIWKDTTENDYKCSVVTVPHLPWSASFGCF